QRSPLFPGQTIPFLVESFQYPSSLILNPIEALDLVHEVGGQLFPDLFLCSLHRRFVHRIRVKVVNREDLLDWCQGRVHRDGNNVIDRQGVHGSSPFLSDPLRLATSVYSQGLSPMFTILVMSWTSRPVRSCTRTSRVFPPIQSNT